MKGWIFCLLLTPLFALETTNHTKSAGYTFTLTEEVRFGGDSDDDHYLWSSLNTKILPGPNGHMYIVDPNTHKVLAFDSDGKFLKEATGPGNGPGELQDLLCASLDAAGKIYIVDVPPGASNATLKVFNPDMSFEKNITTMELGYQPAIVQIAPNGRHLGGMFYKVNMSTGNIQLLYGILDLESKKMLRDFHQVDVPLPDFSRPQDQDMWIDYIAKQFKMLYNFAMFTFDGKGRAYSALSNKYTIDQWSPDNYETLRSITRDYQPRPFKKEERDRLIGHFEQNIPTNFRSIITTRVLHQALERANLPPTLWPLFALVPIEDKGIMVVHDMNPQTRENLVDIFDYKGQYLCQTALPNHAVFTYTESNPYPRMIFRDGKAFTIETTEDGENVAVRYSYKLSPAN